MPGRRPPERRRGRSARHAIREPEAIGWSAPSVNPRRGAVVAVFDGGRLSSGLAALHRERYGPHTRVLDGARGDLPSQLRRAGIEAPLDLRGLTPDTALVLVNAPGRVMLVAALLSEAGAREVHVFGVPANSPAPAPVNDLTLTSQTSDLTAQVDADSSATS